MQGMKELQAMAYEMREALEGGRFDELGPMLRAAHESKKRMNPDIAKGTSIERLFEVARDAGATGGKICGAGGGGYVLLACPPDRAASVRSALEAVGGQFADFAFGTAGVRARIGDRVWRPT
jgi:D-glycero-alpha-D-manno-heptose-7-phosphate kinase